MRKFSSGGGTEQVLNDIAELKEDLNELSNNICNTSWLNLFNVNNLALNTRLTSTGEVGIASENLSVYACTIELVEIDSSKKYHSSINGKIIIAEFTENKLYIQTSQYTNDVNLKTLWIPNEATKYIRFQIYRDLKNNITFCDSEIPITKNHQEPYKRITYLDDKLDINSEKAVKNKVVAESVNALQKELYINKKEYEITNYGLYLDIIPDKGFSANGELVDKTDGRNGTTFVKLDKNKNLYGYTSVSTLVSFYDNDYNFISTGSLYYNNPLLKENYPENAEYVRFVYYPHSLYTDSFAVSTFDNTFAKTLYSTIKKEKFKRPRIDIFCNDTQIDVLKKLCNAFYTGDCDVYFECGEYNFDKTVFEYMKSEFGWTSRFELPIGRNCCYYFGNAIISVNNNSEDSRVYGNASLFGTRDRDDTGSYYLYDGILKGTGVVYIVHDEGSGGHKPYVHYYKNVIFDYRSGEHTSPSISKCIGGGTGLYGEVSINNCVFISELTIDDVSYHGHPHDVGGYPFKLFINGCWFTNTVGLHTLQEEETAICVYNGNSAKSVPASGNRWTVYAMNNENRF